MLMYYNRCPFNALIFDTELFLELLYGDTFVNLLKDEQELFSKASPWSVGYGLFNDLKHVG